MTAVGIDFGTTNSVVAQYAAGEVDVIAVDHPPADWPGGFHRVLPSVFALGAEREPLFGWRAKRQPKGKLEAVKRLFSSEDHVSVGTEEFFVEEVAALLFAELRRASLDQGVDFSQAVVTVPANSRGLARTRTKICAGMAGVEVAALINEPTAAAMAFGLTATDDQTILVVDWGGGTLDVTVLGVIGGIFMEQASKGIQRLGGLDFDREIYKHLTADILESSSWDEPQQSEMRLEVERAKIALSSRDEVSVAIPGGGRRLVTRKKLTEWVQPLVRRAQEPVERCLADLRMTPSSIDHLLLVGGTCMMPMVRDFVGDITGRDAARGVEAMTAVAEGAAVAAAILAGEHDSDFFVSTEHALGTVAVDGRGLPRFSVLIERNHKLPAKETDRFVPVRDYQDSVLLTVIEGDPEKPLDHEDNVVLKEWEVELEPRPADETALDITYEYDVNGILHASVVEANSGKSLFSGDVAFVSGRDPHDLVAMAGRVDSLLQAGESSARGPTTGPSLPNDVVITLERARGKVIPFVPDDEAKRLEELAVALEGGAAEGDHAAAKQELEEALRRYAYLF